MPPLQWENRKISEKELFFFLEDIGRFSQCLGLGGWGYSRDVCGMANNAREKVIFPNEMFGGESLIGMSHVAVKAFTWNSQLNVLGVSGSSHRSMVNQRG